jgi:hypothetical protein
VVSHSTAAARRRWKSTSTDEWTSGDDEGNDRPQAGNIPAPSSARPEATSSGPPAPGGRTSTYHSLSTPDSLCTLCNRPRRLTEPATTIDTSDCEGSESDPDANIPHPPQYLTQHPEMTSSIFNAMTAASLQDASHHPVLGFQLPVVRAHLGEDLPPLHYSTLHDAACAAATSTETGKRRWVFTITGITSPSPDFDVGRNPTGKWIPPGHYINYACSTTDMVGWCRKVGVRKRARITPTTEPPGRPHDHPGCQADLLVPPDPPRPIHDPPADPLALHPQDEPGVVALPKTRQGPPVPVDALAVRNDINPTDLDSYLVRNIDECVFWVAHIPHYTPNDAPWAMEPVAIQEGPMKGITVSWLCNPWLPSGERMRGTCRSHSSYSGANQEPKAAGSPNGTLTWSNSYRDLTVRTSFRRTRQASPYQCRHGALATLRSSRTSHTGA